MVINLICLGRLQRLVFEVHLHFRLMHLKDVLKGRDVTLTGDGTFPPRGCSLAPDSSLLANSAALLSHEQDR